MRRWIAVLVVFATLTLMAGTVAAKAVGTIVFSKNPIGVPVLFEHGPQSK